MIGERDPVSRFVRSIEHPSLNRRLAPVNLPSPLPQTSPQGLGQALTTRLSRAWSSYQSPRSDHDDWAESNDELSVRASCRTAVRKTFRKTIRLERPKNRFFDA
jgi:hypothetical protein